MRYFVYFGQNGWTKKFHEVLKVVNQSGNLTSVSGLVIGDTLNDKCVELRKEVDFYESIDELYDLAHKYSKIERSESEVAEAEEKIGCSLWNVLNAERRYVTHLHQRRYVRHRFSQNELRNIGCGMIEYFDQKLDNVDCVIMQNPSSGWAYSLALLATKRGKIFRAIRSCAHPNDRAIWHSTPYEIFTEVEQAYEALSIGQIEEKGLADSSTKFLQEFRGQAASASWMNSTAATPLFYKASDIKLRLAKIFKALLTLASRSGSRPKELLKFNDPLYANLIIQFFRIKRIVQTKFISKNSVVPAANQNFALLCLSLEPESAISVNAPNCFDQSALIKDVAQNLPASWQLVVKEHPSMIGWRDADFYKNICRIPNVLLCDPKSKTRDLIEASSLVLTINGTVGWEASLLKKPVLVFGHAFYRNLPTVRTVSVRSQIYDEILELMEIKHEDKDIIHFLTALNLHTFEVSFRYHWEINDRNDEAVDEMQHTTKMISETLVKSIHSSLENS